VRSVKDLARDIAGYRDELRSVDVPEALAAAIVLDFAQQLHVGAEPAGSAPGRDDVAAAAAAKRADRAAQLSDH
jgi:hypothetical protein